MTVSELKEILKDMPDETIVTILTCKADKLRYDDLDCEDIIYYESKILEHQGTLCFIADN